MLRANVGDHNQVGKFEALRYLEPILYLFETHRRSERAEGFAHLDHRVDAITHLRMAGIGQVQPATSDDGSDLGAALWSETYYGRR